jgi:hypothetical protein
MLSIKKSKYKYLDEHNWFNRLESVTDNSDATLLESLDRDWVQAGIQAERKCTRHHPFAFVNRIAKLRNQRRAVKIQILELALGKRMSLACQGPLEKCSPNFTHPTTLAELFSLKHAINKDINTLEKYPGCSSGKSLHCVLVSQPSHTGSPAILARLPLPDPIHRKF